MTKKQALAELVKLGCSNIVPDGKFCVYVTLPSGERALCDPKDMVRELQERGSK
jgi:hypothetical protein